MIRNRWSFDWEIHVPTFIFIWRICIASSGEIPSHCCRICWILPPTSTQLIKPSREEEALSRNMVEIGSFRIPVREIAIWQQEEVEEALVDALSFLSDDEFHFEWAHYQEKRILDDCIQFSEIPLKESVSEVVLFSGGLDSLGGAVQELIVDQRPVLLLNHRPTPKLAPSHQRLIDSIKATHGRAFFVHLPVRVNKDRGLNSEMTQRTRSFLFASLGYVLATSIGLNRFRFYENGVVSLNLPLATQVVGARASRTTHPRTLSSFSRLFSLLSSRSFRVENPFQCKTRTEIVESILEAGCGHLIGGTISCVHTWNRTNQHPHCGTCSQCIDRRLAVLAAQASQYDPADGYKVDLLTGNREQSSRTMLAVYLETANRIPRYTPADFFAHFGEAVRAFGSLEHSPELSAVAIYEMMRRHSEAVNRVVDSALRDHATAIRQRALPSTCLVRLVSDTSQASVPAQSVHPESNGARPRNLFRKQGSTWEVRFAGGRTFTIPSSLGASYLHLLLCSPGTRFKVDEMIHAVQGKELPESDSADDCSDEIALAEYRSQIQTLESLLKDPDDELPARERDKLSEELEFLRHHCQSEKNVKGQSRKLSSETEKRRKAVTNAISRVIRAIKNEDQALAAHLQPPCLVRGSECSYTPSEEIPWHL